MEKVVISINDAKLNALNIAEFEPTFQIQNGDTVYDCDPSIAVEQAHLVFSGYEACKHVGYIKINIADKKNLLSLIVGFLHGKPLCIDTMNAFTVVELSKALGIPFITDYAARVASKFQNAYNIISLFYFSIMF